MPAHRYPHIIPLQHLLAQVVNFSQDDYSMPGSVMPDSVSWNISYTCACFIAQHTVNGDEGVETEVAQVGLKIGTVMPYKDRVKLAEKLIAEYGGQYPKTK